jgi:molybdopterin-biosynthesis enzyme MoeA-like protein
MSTATKTARREYTPSQEEISRMTAKIRQSWTPEVRAARRRMARNFQNIVLLNNDRTAAA